MILRIRLTEHMTFLNKAGLRRVLRDVTVGTRVTIDATTTRIIDHDVMVVLREFAAHAQTAGIAVEFKGARIDNDLGDAD